MINILNTVQDRVVSLLSEEARVWFHDAMSRTRDSFEQERFLLDFSALSRQLGKAQLCTAKDEDFGGAGFSALRHGSVDEVGRAALLLQTADVLKKESFTACVQACFRYSDNRELCALLKSLPLLPYPEEWVGQAREACRSNILNVFESIACENPYPQQHFSQEAMNQMVMKAFFLDVPVSRIIGLNETANEERMRMARDYRKEREAAGRPVPEDLEKVIRNSHPCTDTKINR